MPRRLATGKIRRMMRKPVAVGSPAAPLAGACAPWSSRGLAIAWGLAFVPSALLGQTLVELRLSRAEARVGEEVVVSLVLRSGGLAPWCGLRVELGDGQTRDLRIGMNGDADLTSSLAVRHAAAGTYTVRATGRALLRGLRSAPACDGGSLSAMLRVHDPGGVPPAPPAADRSAAGTVPFTAPVVAPTGAPFAAPILARPVPPEAAPAAAALPDRASVAEGPPVPQLPAALPAVTAPPPMEPARPGPAGMVALPTFGDRTSAPTGAGRTAPAATGPVAAPAVTLPGIGPLPGLPTTPSLPERPPLPPRDAPGPQAARGCVPAPAMEARDYAQPEFIGRPDGRVARMCFYRSDGRSAVENLNFYANGHVVFSGSRSAGGFAGGVTVLGAARGTYGVQGGRLALRLAYAGTGVSQSGRGAGTQRELDTSGREAFEQAMVLPNCQRITVRDMLQRLEMPAGPGHPPYLVIDGVRWEQMGIDCPAWQGWR